MTVVRSLWFGDVLVPANTKRQIVAATATAHGLTVDEIMTRTIRRKVAHARQEAMWIMWSAHRRDGAYSYSIPQIGAVFGLDHTTVLFGLKAHAERAGLQYVGRSGKPAVLPIRSKVMAARRLAA